MTDWDVFVFYVIGVFVVFLLERIAAALRDICNLLSESRECRAW